MRNTVREMLVNFPLLKTGLILDVNNLYFAVQSKFGKRKLQITEYVRFLEKLGHTLVYKIAYSRQEADAVPGFVALLKNNGFETNFGNKHWGTAMALRAADIVPNVDCFVLGTNFPDASRILQWAKEKGKITKCFALSIPPFFKQFAECLEIPPEILSSEATTPTKPMELPANSGSDVV